MLTRPDVFQLTLAPLIPPVAKALGKGALWVYGALVVVFGLLILLSGLGWSLWYAPFVLSAVMVLVMAAILVPVVGGFCWFLVKLTRYTLAEEGVTQGAGAIFARFGQREISWLEFRRLEVSDLAGVIVVRAVAGELDPPVTIYHSLLVAPEAFWHTWMAKLPKTSVVYSQSEQLVAQLLKNKPLNMSAMPAARPAAFQIPPFS